MWKLLIKEIENEKFKYRCDHRREYGTDEEDKTEQGEVLEPGGREGSEEK